MFQGGEPGGRHPNGTGRQAVLTITLALMAVLAPVGGAVAMPVEIADDDPQGSGGETGLSGDGAEADVDRGRVATGGQWLWLGSRGKSRFDRELNQTSFQAPAPAQERNETDGGGDGNDDRTGDDTVTKLSTGAPLPAPLGERLRFDPETDGAPIVNASDEWVYRERYDRPIEGLEPPVWVLVFPDNVAGAGYSWDASPPPGQPTKSYEIRNGTVVPTADTAGSEPTDDLYVVVAPRANRSLVRAVAERAAAPNRLLFGDRVLIEDANAPQYPVTFEVAGTNATRTASFEVTPTPPRTNLTARFDAGDATLGERSIVEYEWSFGDGRTASTDDPVVTHTYTSNGTYNVSLTVRDTAGTTANRTRSLDVRSPNGTDLTITDVRVDPRGPLPNAPRLNKTVRAAVVAPDGVDRVVFRVGTDRYVDTSGDDGWSTTVPLSRYPPDSNVTVRAVGRNGTTDVVTRGLGIAGVGGIIQYVLDNAGGETETAARGAKARPTVIRFAPDRIRYEVTYPPPIVPDEATFPLVIATAGWELGADLGVVVYTEDPGVAVSGEGKIEGQIPPIKTEGGLRIRAINNFSDSGQLFEVDSAQVRGVFRLGGVKGTGFGLLGYGIEAEVFFGWFIRFEQIRYTAATDFPLHPSDAELFTGIEASGEIETDIPAGDLTGTLRLQGGAEKTGRFTLSGLFDGFGPKGRVVLQGQLNFLIKSTTFKEVREFPPDTSTSTTRRTTSNRTLRRHNGTTPLVDGGELRTSRAEASEAGMDRRLTADGYADESPALTTLAEGYLLAWERQSPDRTVIEGHDIYVRAADATADFGDTVRVTNDSRVDVDPDVTTAGDSALAAWTRLNRTFTNASAVTPNVTFAAQEIAVARSAAANGTRTPSDWTAPTTLTDARGAAFRPRVGYASGQYRLAWRYDTDGDPRSLADTGVRYATYDPANGSLGAITTIRGATDLRLAGARLVYFRPDTPGGENGTIGVRNLTTDTERTARVTGFEDLAITTVTAVWVTGDGPEETVRYLRANGSVGTVPTPTVSGINDVELVTRRITNDRRVDLLVFDARGASVNGTAGETGVYYRVRQNDTWGPSRRLTTGRTDLTVRDVTATGHRRGIVAVVAAENVSAPAEQPDLFAITHGYAADLNVSTTLPPELVPGESTRIGWTVRNEGGAAARNVTVTVKTDAGQPVAVVDAGSIPAGAQTSGVVRIVLPRSPTLTARANGSGSSTRNDSTTRTILRPDLELGAIERAPASAGVAYTVTVRNTGAVGARDITPAVTANGRPVANASIEALAPGANATIRLVVPTDRTGGGLVTRVRADTGDRIAERNESTGIRRIAPPRPDLFVTAIGSRATVGIGGDRINVTVGNRGFAGATATVQVSAGDRSVTRNVTLVGTPAGTSRFETITVPMDELNVTAGQTVLVRVTPGTLDARPADNVAQTTVTVIAPDPDGDGRRARDPDGDGDYEDIDGDGQFGILDIAVFLGVFDGTAADPRFFDFTDDDEVDIADVAALLREV